MDIDVYTFGNFVQPVATWFAPVLLVGALSRLLLRWPLVNTLIGVGARYAWLAWWGDLYSPALQYSVTAAVLVFLFFEWRERAGLDALAPFKRWRDRRKGARARGV